MFEWGHLTSAINESEPTVYRCNGIEVARLRQNVASGIWSAILNQHLITEPRVIRECSSFENGRSGVELWAERHRQRLEAEVAEIERHRPYRAWMPSGQRDAPKG